MSASETQKCQEDETPEGQVACLSHVSYVGAGFESGLPHIPSQGWARGDIFLPSPALFLLFASKPGTTSLLDPRCLT